MYDAFPRLRSERNYIQFILVCCRGRGRIDESIVPGGPCGNVQGYAWDSWVVGSGRGEESLDKITFAYANYKKRMYKNCDSIYKLIITCITMVENYKES